MQNSDKVFVDSFRESAFAQKRDDSCLRLLGDEGSFDKLSEAERIQFLRDNCKEIDPEEIYDGGFVLELLDAVQNAALDFAMNCPHCGEELNADNACLGYTPSPAPCPFPNHSAVCVSCNREICFSGDDGWFDDDFNQIAFATVQRIRTSTGEEFFREVDEAEINPPGGGPPACENGTGESVLWQAKVYDLVWGEEDFCRKYRQSLSIDDAAMSRNSEIAYDLICSIGQEIR